MTYVPNDFAHRCELPGAPAGSALYAVASEPKPGRCVVEYDSKRWLYHVCRGERRAFRSWVRNAFGGSFGRVEGRYPFLSVQRES